jgi:hypothetical protein
MMMRRARYKAHRLSDHASSGVRVMKEEKKEKEQEKEKQKKKKKIRRRKDPTGLE